MTLPRKQLHVLLVEDSQDDADLILLELGKTGFDIDWKRVETEAALREAMKSGSWDIAISDFNLPRFDARKALEVLRETDEIIPFIIVSGCIGEESAIALMKEGASDFVMKDKLARLAPVVERELKDAAMRQEHRLAQETLQANEKLLSGITSSLGEGLLVMNDEGTLLFMNPEAERLLGWTESELFGKDANRIIHSQKRDGAPMPEGECGILGVIKNGGVFKTSEDVFICKNGAHIPVSLIATAIKENSKAVASVVVFQDVSQRKQAERDLLESREQLRELSSYLQTVREEERTRIARELHDELGQMLTAVKLDAMWLDKHMSGEEQKIRDKIGSMTLLIDETLDAMRRVAADLRPVMLDDLGMVAAIEWLTQEFATRTGINTLLEQDMGQAEFGCGGSCEKENCKLDAAVATAAFRIAQECLTNIARHAQAKNVKVFLKCRDGKLMMWVTDDGKGIETGVGNTNKSYGIIGMQERAIGLGGKMSVSGSPGKGTSVEIVLPVKFVNCTDLRE